MWKLDFTLRRHSGPIQCIDVSQDMKYIATASSDRSVGWTDLQTRQTQYLQAHQDSVYCVSFSPSTSHLVSGSSDGTAVLWDGSTGEKLGSFKGHQLTVRSVCWSPDGKFIATGSNDQRAVIWSLNRFTKRQVLSGLKGWVRDVKWHGNTIAVGGNDNKVLLFDSRTGKVAQTIETGTAADISSLSFHYSGNCLASGSFDQMVRIWDLRTATLLQRHAAHTSNIMRVAFNPYDDELLSIGKDGVARLWSMRTTSIVACFQQHESGILGCSWLPSGRGFVTCGEDRRICGYKIEDLPIDPNKLEYDGGDIAAALDRMQRELTSLAVAMKTLDRRLLLQEEKIQWLSDIDEPITRSVQSLSVKD